MFRKTQFENYSFFPSSVHDAGAPGYDSPKHPSASVAGLWSRATVQI